MKKSIVVPILNNEYKVIVCWGTLAYTRQLMRDWGYEELAEQKHLDSTRGVCFHSKECHPFIVLPHFPKTAEEIGTLAHEAFHAVDDILEKIGRVYNDEIFAHSIGAVVRSVLSIDMNKSHPTATKKCKKCGKYHNKGRKSCAK